MGCFLSENLKDIDSIGDELGVDSIETRSKFAGESSVTQLIVEYSSSINSI